ncbi:aldehyde dehydrogenase family protein [Salmonella enterica subsp. enterica]|nr:aldehyde dehydrogenase family protein [Salmonella enterica subsp. enterica]
MTACKPDVAIGPLIDEKPYGESRGTYRRRAGKRRPASYGRWRTNWAATSFQPTILADVSDNAKVAERDIRAARASVPASATGGRVIRQANDTEFGTAAYFYTCTRFKRVFASAKRWNK